MPDTWTILKGNSSLASDDAWEHLNNQLGNGGETVIGGAGFIYSKNPIQISTPFPLTIAKQTEILTVSELITLQQATETITISTTDRIILEVEDGQDNSLHRG